VDNQDSVRPDKKFGGEKTVTVASLPTN